MTELRTKSESFEKKLFDSQRFTNSAMRIINSFFDKRYCTDHEILKQLKTGRGEMPLGRLKKYLIKLESMEFLTNCNLITHMHPSCHKQAHILVDLSSDDTIELKNVKFFTSRTFFMTCTQCLKRIHPSEKKYSVGSENVWSLSEKGLLAVLSITKNPSSLYGQYPENMLVKICYFLMKNKMKNQVYNLQEILKEDILLGVKSSKQNSQVRNNIKKIKNTKTLDSKSLEIQKSLPITI